MPLIFCTVVLAGAVVASMVAAAGRVRRSEPSPVLDTRLFINSANETELALLPHIGPALAGRIVAARRASGGFASIGDLAKVRGIGPKVAEAIGPLVRFD